MHTSIDWLTYKSYEFNRLNRPDIPYYKWRQLYQDAVLYEEIFLNNLKQIQREGAWGHVSYSS